MNFERPLGWRGSRRVAHEPEVCPRELLPEANEDKLLATGSREPQKPSLRAKYQKYLEKRSHLLSVKNEISLIGAEKAFFGF
jgi:hypothetical protein